MSENYKLAKEIYIPRFLEKEILKYLGKKEIIAIIGPRQCGKTTLLKNIFKNLVAKKKVFIDFEDREILELFVNDIKSFAELYAKENEFLFIDEFQYADEGGKNLKYLFDSYRTKIFISGSSATELSIQSIRHLVGRIFVFTLFPFSFDEFLSYKDKKLFEISKKKKLSNEIISKINSFYEEFLVYGGYPRVILSKDASEKETVLKNIYNIYLLKEIKGILGFKEDYKLTKLIHALALQVGGMANYDELSRTTGFHYKELIESINILNKTFITCESRPFYKNQRLELVKTPKLFFIDNGFRNMIIKNFQHVKDRTDLGALNENFVASELSKSGFELRYWRTKSNAEVDFVIKKNSEIVPIEIKSKASREIVTKSLHSFIDKYSPKEAFVLLSQLFSSKKENSTSIRFIPHWYINNLISN